jgi:hypothetical protein
MIRSFKASILGELPLLAAAALALTVAPEKMIAQSSCQTYCSNMYEEFVSSCYTSCGSSNYACLEDCLDQADVAYEECMFDCAG